MPSRRDDLLIFLALIAVVVATVVLAAALPAAPGPAHAPGAGAPPPSAAFGDRDRTCAEWSDGCIVCQRGEHAPACSTPGIACTRGPVQCLRRTGG